MCACVRIKTTECCYKYFVCVSVCVCCICIINTTYNWSYVCWMVSEVCSSLTRYHCVYWCVRTFYDTHTYRWIKVIWSCLLIWYETGRHRKANTLGMRHSRMWDERIFERYPYIYLASVNMYIGVRDRQWIRDQTKSCRKKHCPNSSTHTTNN